MGINLSGGPSFSWAAWKLCLEVAARHGWNPGETHQRDHFCSVEQWSSAFGLQTVPDPDARIGGSVGSCNFAFDRGGR
jgi:hypothetical protein